MPTLAVRNPIPRMSPQYRFCPADFIAEIWRPGIQRPSTTNAFFHRAQSDILGPGVLGEEHDTNIGCRRRRTHRALGNENRRCGRRWSLRRAASPGISWGVKPADLQRVITQLDLLGRVLRPSQTAAIVPLPWCFRIRGANCEIRS